MSRKRPGGKRSGETRHQVAAATSAEPAEEARPAAIQVSDDFRSEFMEAVSRAQRSLDDEADGGGKRDGDGHRALASLRDIAGTFKAHATVLDSILETQRRLVSSLGRNDRSEMTIQSMRALNETFRSLQATQRELATRLVAGDAGGERGGHRSLLLAGLLFVLAAGGLFGAVLVFRGRASEEAELRLASLEAEMRRAGNVASTEAAMEGLLDSFSGIQQSLSDYTSQNATLMSELHDERLGSVGLAEDVEGLRAELDRSQDVIVELNLGRDAAIRRLAESEDARSDLLRRLTAIRQENLALREANRLAGVPPTAMPPMSAETFGPQPLPSATSSRPDPSTPPKPYGSIRAGGDAPIVAAEESEVLRDDRDLLAIEPDGGFVLPGEPGPSPAAPDGEPGEPGSMSEISARAGGEEPSPGTTSPIGRADAPTRGRSADAWRMTLNALLRADRHGELHDRYRFESIRAIADGEALGVRLNRVSGTRIVKSYEADALHAVIDVANGWVELRMRDGHLEVAGREVSFIDGTFTLIIMDADIDRWLDTQIPFARAAAEGGAGADTAQAPPR